MNRLDIHERMPEAMVTYLSNYGWHFSKKMCDWAISRMRDRKGQRFDPISREKIDTWLKQYNLEIKNDLGYDAVFVANMAKSDFWGGAIGSEQQLATFIRDYLDDPDGYEGVAFSRFYADCIASGVPIVWEDRM